MPLSVIRKDIARVKADAIVSASGHSFKSHGAVSSAIFLAAGPGLQEECDKTGFLDTAEVLVTGAYGLPAKAVIHTVGPSWQDGHRGEGLLLQKCYENCMKAAWEKGFKSIAFPLISSGGYHFPKEHALKTAMEAIAAFEHFDEMEVTLAVYDRSSYEVSRDLLEEIADYIGGFLSCGAPDLSEGGFLSCSAPVEHQVPLKGGKAPAGVPKELAEKMKYRDENFAEMLNRLILERDVKSSAIYKAANVSKAVFSNIFCKEGYKVKKGTALALAIALELDLEETKELLAKAGHGMSAAFKQDKVVEYFIVHKKYNIFEINEVLFAYDLPRLGEKN